MAPHAPQRSDRPGQAVALLDPAIRSRALSTTRSPLATWLPDGAALTRFRRRLGGDAHRAPAAGYRVAPPRAGLDGRGRPRPGRPAVSPRVRSPLRPLGRPAAPAPRARHGGHRVSAPGPRGAPARRPADGGHPRRPPRPAPRGVLVPVHREGPRTRGHGPAPRRPRRRLLAPARGAAHGDPRPAGPPGHRGRPAECPRRSGRPGLAHDRSHARHALLPAALHAPPRPVSRSLARPVPHLVRPATANRLRARPRRLARRLARRLRPRHPDSLGEPRPPLDPGPDRARAGCLLHEALDTGRPHPACRDRRASWRDTSPPCRASPAPCSEARIARPSTSSEPTASSTPTTSRR